MKKILMLSTGGTIASTDSGHGLTPTESGAAMAAMIPELQGLCEISCYEVMSIDSSNMQPEGWTTLAQAIKEHSDGFDGVVITHGTDTMAYTASALSFMLKNLPFPVVLTGSQLPISAPDTDAKRNILHAFLTALDDRLCGVYIVFDYDVIKGIHAEKTRSTTFHAFESINAPLVGTYVDNVLQINEAMIPEKPTEPLQVQLDLCNDVFLLKITPGFEPARLKALGDLGYKAIIIEGFGIGGIPNEGRDLVPAVKALTDKGILTIITTQCTYEGADLDIYSVGVSAAEAGAIAAGPMTSETILAKLMCITAKTDDFHSIRDRFRKDVIGEWKVYGTAD
ncbi:MAG: asparaginase [Solobacterium sp.]|nr:asparaginase [Solobacterium sp.]